MRALIARAVGKPHMRMWARFGLQRGGFSNFETARETAGPTHRRWEASACDRSSPRAAVGRFAMRLRRC